MAKTRIKVSKERWQKAQKWEKNFWISAQKQRAKLGKNAIWKLFVLFGLKPKYRGDDWNYWWKEQFDEYNFLPDHVSNSVELGCGPYTNFRLINKTCSSKHLFLSDPLVRTYISFKQTFVSEMYRKGGCLIDDHSIENCPFADAYFDVTVMINVLDHVCDAELCIHNAIKITKPSGILIIGQDLTNDTDWKRIDSKSEDIGHPIKVDHLWLDSLLDNQFEPVCYKILSREDGRSPQAHYGTYLFAGKKLLKCSNQS